ncbi:MAG: thioredoxin family protein [Acidobacteriaceae bacterium]|jgi:thiol:disulfide interchange protein DsbD
MLGPLLALGAVASAAHAPAQIPPVGDGGPGPVKAQHLTAELVALGPAIAPGGAQMVGLVLTIEEHWHVYWINAGDSGEPPHIAWTLPAGLTAGPMQFPIPERLPLGPLMDFGYEDEVAFPVRIEAAPSARPGPAHLDAKVDWLVCAQVCIPGKAHLGLDLTVQPGAPQLDQEQKLGALGEAMTLVPSPLPTGDKFSVTGGAKGFKLMLTDGKREADAEFYPYPSESVGKDATDVIANAAEQMIESRRDGIDLYVPRSPDLTALPATLHGVFKLSDTVAYEVSAPVASNPATAYGSPTGPSPASPTTSTATVAQLGLAFLGGIILNLMPCVFPVLFLKGLSLVQSSGQQRATVRQHGLVYAAGIVASFWAIVALLLVLRATGSQIGWGFQLQSPVFVAVLASFMFFFALSLAGQFDIGLSLTSVGSSLVDGPNAKQHGYAGSFFTGVLATVVATPCAAPLMGAAVGFALAQPAGITFAIFTALALGLAAPYVLLSWHPAWARLLPKPGAWMEVLKQVTAVPLFATAIWLAWVYGQLRGTDGVDQLALLLTSFLVLAIAGWVLGRWPAKWPRGIAATALIALALAIPLSQRSSRVSGAAPGAPAQPGTGAQSAVPNGPVWQPYSQQALDTARAAGNPVFIDFTAAWCLSCQVNERLVLRAANIEVAFQANHVTLLKADWTNQDPQITAKLASLGRASVPTYVIYPAAAGSPADVLPEALTRAGVLAAIQRDAS